MTWWKINGTASLLSLSLRALNKVRLEFAMTGFAEATEAQEESTFYLRCFLVSNDSNRVECSWHFQSTMSRPFFWLIAIIIKEKLVWLHCRSSLLSNLDFTWSWQLTRVVVENSMKPNSHHISEGLREMASNADTLFLQRFSRCAPDFKLSSLDRSFFGVWHVETRRIVCLRQREENRKERRCQFSRLDAMVAK